MRRPSLGPRIMRGIYLIWKKTTINVKNGYIPHTWSPRDQQDVKRALRYLGLLVDWSEAQGKGKEEEDATAETDVA